LWARLIILVLFSFEWWVIYAGHKSSLMSLVRNIKVPSTLLFNLFDAYVLSFINYGCAVWGNITLEVMERVHKKFCKWVLNVKQSTNTLALYGELRRFPLYIEIHIRMVKYFLKINTIKADNCILSVVRYAQIDSVQWDCNTTNWASNVRDSLQSSGLNEVWLIPSSVRL